MLKNQIILRLLFLFTVMLVGAHITSVWAQSIYSFPSPDSSTAIIVMVDSTNSAEFFVKNEDGQELIFERKLRVEPSVEWIDNNYAEFFLPTGSPNYSKVFFSRYLNKVSNEYVLALDFDPKSKIVATLDIDAINFFKAFDGSLVMNHKVTGLEPIHFLVFCDYSGSFEKDRMYEFSYECNPQIEFNDSFPLTNSLQIELVLE